MNLRPTLSALSRHKSAALILLLEVALTCAILCHALFLIQRRINAIDVTTGVDEAHLVRIQLGGIGRDDDDRAQTLTDLAALRALPGVANASVLSQLPLVNSSWNTGLSTQLESDASINATMYMGDEAMLDTLGLKPSTGRAFTPDEFTDVMDEAAFSAYQPHTAIITRTLADKLYPGQNALGKPFYTGSAEPITIIGIVDTLLRPGHGGQPGESVQYSMLLPVRFPYSLVGQYVIRTRPGADPSAVLDAAVAELKRQNPRRVFLGQDTFGQIRADYFAQDRAMVWLLGVVSVVLLAVTAFGIVGLASFWVQQRTKQIGVRRALGATRGDILRYFQGENFLIVTGGIVLGMLLAFAINQALMSRYELPRLPWQVLPIGALVLWLLGQLAVLWPALRAASIPPATATRSV